MALGSFEGLTWEHVTLRVYMPARLYHRQSYCLRMLTRTACYFIAFCALTLRRYIRPMYVTQRSTQPNLRCHAYVDGATVTMLFSSECAGLQSTSLCSDHFLASLLHHLSALINTGSVFTGTQHCSVSVSEGVLKHCGFDIELLHSVQP